jgi:hypothetical protein
MSASRIPPGFVSLRDTWSGNNAIWPNEYAARWALRKARRDLAAAEAVALVGRELYVHPERASDVLRGKAISSFQRRAGTGVDRTTGASSGMSATAPLLLADVERLMHALEVVNQKALDAHGKGHLECDDALLEISQYSNAILDVVGQVYVAGKVYAPLRDRAAGGAS